jgi:hypothetical protein
VEYIVGVNPVLIDLGLLLQYTMDRNATDRGLGKAKFSTRGLQ